MTVSIVRSAFATITLGLAGLALPAFAQPSAVEIEQNKVWQHEWTKMSFPAQIDGFEREQIIAFEERETNISARYLDDSTDSILSLYIYRPGNPSTAIWFDRALVAIGVQGDTYGSVDLENLNIATFTPPGGTAESGQLAVLEVDGPFRSTSVALYRAGEWLVKIRLSSRDLTVPQMSALLKKTIAGLPALDDVDPNPAQYVEQCPTNINPSDAQPVKVDIGMAVMMGVMPSPFLLSEGIEQQGFDLPAPSQAVRYCREDARRQEYNIYRPNQREDSYSIALGDSGTSIEVFPDQTMSLVKGEASDGAKTIYIVQSSSGLTKSFHTPFASVPSPKNTADSAFDGPVLISINRPLSEEDKNEVRVNSDVISDQ